MRGGGTLSISYLHNGNYINDQLNLKHVISERQEGTETYGNSGGNMEYAEPNNPLYNEIPLRATGEPDQENIAELIAKHDTERHTRDGIRRNHFSWYHQARHQGAPNLRQK